MDASVLPHLVMIKWALVVIAACLIVLTVGAFSVSWSLSALPDLMKGRASFADQAKKLLDQGKLEELIDLCRKHIDEFPGDAHGYWFKGQADFRKGNLRHALVSLRKVEELQPDWDAVHTGPLIKVIEARLAEGGEKRELKVVTPETDAPPSE